MKGYRFITDDDTSEFCHRVTEALSNGWKLYGEPKMTFDKKRGVMRCGQAVIKSSPKKKYTKKIIKLLFVQNCFQIIHKFFSFFIRLLVS